MSLESGKYTITSKIDGAPVGRRLAEFSDTRPKGIFKLPQAMAAHPTVWEVEKLKNGNYTFKAIRHIVGDIDGRLFAILFEDQIPNATTTEWTVKRDERDTEGNAYIVLAAGRNDGWTAPVEDDEQILIKPTIAGSSFPPTYLPSNVFVFKKLD